LTSEGGKKGEILSSPPLWTKRKEKYFQPPSLWTGRGWGWGSS